MPESINYQQPDYVEKRVRYFDGQYLKVQDFVEEQQYHIDHQRRHNRFLYVSGITDGLKVEAKTNSLVVTISPGTAIDRDGRQILLNRSFSFNNEEFPKPGETSSKNPGAELDLQPYKDKGQYDLFIVYDERETDVQKQEGSENSTRFHERPKIELFFFNQQQPNDYKGIKLARLNIKADQVDVDNSVRQYSGLRLPGAENSEVTLRYGGDKNSKLAVLDGNLSITGTVKATTFQGNGSELTGIVKKAGDTITGNLEILDTMKITTDDKGITFFGDAKIFKKSGSGLKIQAHNDTQGIEFLKQDGLTSMMLLKDGNVGIGTTSPTAALHIISKTHVVSRIEAGNTEGWAEIDLYSTYNVVDRKKWNIAARGSGGFAIRQLTDSRGELAIPFFINTDGNVGIGTTTPQGFQIVLPERNKIASLAAGVTISGGKDGNANIELRNNGSGTPYIDFAKTTNPDYDARIILTETGKLEIQGAKLIANGAVVTGMIVMWSGSVNAIPSGWALCDGKNGTPNLVDRFIYGSSTHFSSVTAPSRLGGASSHSHSMDTPSASDNALRGYTGSTAWTAVSTNTHTHNLYDQNHLPPYYRLAFIIKL